MLILMSVVAAVLSCLSLGLYLQCGSCDPRLGSADMVYIQVTLLGVTRRLVGGGGTHCILQLRQ